MWVIVAPSSGWIRPLVASVTQQAALNQIRASGLVQKCHECDRAARKEINGAVGRDGVLSAWALWRDVQLSPDCSSPWIVSLEQEGRFSVPHTELY